MSFPSVFRAPQVTMIKTAISPRAEMLAYETLWALPKASKKHIAEMFERNPVVPTKLLRLTAGLFAQSEIADLEQRVASYLDRIEVPFSVCVHGTFQYPLPLRDARHPIEVFYYRGDIGLLESPCISIVGTRNCSPEGARRAARLARGLVEQGYTVVSGLAKGIDTAAMTAAIEAGGHIIGIIGTPIHEYYPKENRDLQETIARQHLLISQVPFYRYNQEPFSAKRFYFPQRNETMAAISSATIIVEASDSSGTLTQARACMQQGRSLFILNSCFDRTDITWPAKYEKEGAVRVRDIDDVLRVVGTAKRKVTAES